jgi:uncharacterized RDD family membrane protein YckC
MTPRDISSGYSSEIIVRRWIGCWIDFVVIVGVLLAADGILGNELYRKTLILWLGIVLLYFPVLEATTGRTLGKLVSGIIVVDSGGAVPSIGKVLVRTMLRLFEVNPFLAGGIPAGLVANFSKAHQRLGDMAAGTYVILQRDTSRIGSPPAVRSWAPGRAV